jgi:hypothetical protein
VTDSLSGNYESTLEPQHPMKPRMHLQNANNKFGKFVERYGYTRPFRMINGEIDMEFAYLSSEDNIIHARYRESRGAELPGTVNLTVLERLFRQQSAQWGPQKVTLSK